MSSNLSYENSSPNWSATGIEPSADFKSGGFSAGYKPPASYFNWFWTQTSKCITELQQKSAGKTVATTSFGNKEIFNDYENNVATGDNSHAEGAHTTASGDNSHAEGAHTTASGVNSHAQNVNTTASGSHSHAGGMETSATGLCSFTHGYNVTADDLNCVIGKYSKAPTAASPISDVGDLFIIGNGTSSSGSGTVLSNAFRVTAAGQCLGTTYFASSGADYAELFEWLDGNPDGEDRRGLFVTLDGEKIRLATAEDDYILGAISANPTVIGDSASEDWHGKYERDVFGERVLENGSYKLSKEFDSEKDITYTSRLERAEWGAVGLTGKLVIVDDGTCEVNGYCYPSNNGIATASEKGYRVMSRIDETHIRVLIK